MTAGRARSRARVWPWITVLIVTVLVVGAWFAGEWVARQVVADQVRGTIIAELDLPRDQPIDVDVAGVVIPQLIAGRLDDITVAADDVAIGAFGGDVRVRAQDVPIRGDAAASSASATVRVDEPQLQRLLATVDGFPAEAVGIDEPNVTASFPLDVLGAHVDIGVGLTPSAEDGDLVLSPAVLKLGGAEVSSEEMRDRFGAVADRVLRDWPVCLASQLPAGVTLRDASVDGAVMSADFLIDGAIVVDPALQEPGRCA